MFISGVVAGVVLVWITQAALIYGGRFLLYRRKPRELPYTIYGLSKCGTVERTILDNTARTVLADTSRINLSNMKAP